jgi:hypothetical protein
MTLKTEAEEAEQDIASEIDLSVLLDGLPAYVPPQPSMSTRSQGRQVLPELSSARGAGSTSASRLEPGNTSRADGSSSRVLGMTSFADRQPPINRNAQGKAILTATNLSALPQIEAGSQLSWGNGESQEFGETGGLGSKEPRKRRPPHHVTPQEKFDKLVKFIGVSKHSKGALIKDVVNEWTAISRF